MVMKDKITKNHRKGYYYKAKHIGLVISCGFVALAIIVIPTYITLSSQNKQTNSIAEDHQSEKQEEETPTSVSNLALLSFNNLKITDR